MMKHQGQNIPMEMIKKHRYKQNFRNSQLYATNIVSWWNRKRHDFFNCKSKGKSQCGSFMQCAKDYVKYGKHDVEPVHIFLSGSGGTGKSHLVKLIDNIIPKTFLYHCKDTEKRRVLLLGPTGILAVNIGATIIHSGLGIAETVKVADLTFFITPFMGTVVDPFKQNVPGDTYDNGAWSSLRTKSRGISCFDITLKTSRW